MDREQVRVKVGVMGAFLTNRRPFSVKSVRIYCLFFFSVLWPWLSLLLHATEIFDRLHCLACSNVT